MASRRRSLQPLSQHNRTHHHVQHNILNGRYRQLPPATKSLVMELTEIYFNEETRKKHINNIIDSYFDGRVGQHEHKTVKLPEPVLPLNLRRRSSLINRSAREDLLANTCPNPFNGVTRSEVVEMNNTFLSDQSLPPIFEAREDPEAGTSSGLYNMALSSLIEENKSQQRSLVNTVQSSQSLLIKRRPKVTSENELCRVMHVFQTQSKHATFMVKQYKPECTEVFLREQKAWSVLASLDLPRLWMQTGLLSCQARPFRSLKTNLFEISRESMKSETIYKIHLRQHYDQLFGNDNEVLKRMLISLCKQLATVKGKLINHKISLSNISVVNDEAVIIEWGHSAMMESAKVGGETVSSQTMPILKGATQWFVTPEYLPPEFLDHVAGAIEYDVWKLPSAVDMWSIGCMLLELFTLVPLWAPHRCQITGRGVLSRRGLFHSKTRELSEISTKQRKFCSNIKLHLDRLGEIDKRASPKLVDLMMRLLSVQPEKRPIPEQVVACLN